MYLQAEERGKGFASQAIAFYERLCHERGLEAMYLTVNKHNDLGIRAYLGKGFETIDAVETDIGNGFVMDDFIMEKRVEYAREAKSPTVLAEPSATRVLIYAAVESLLASATVSQPSGTSASLWHCVQYITEARCALWHSLHSISPCCG